MIITGVKEENSVAVYSKNGDCNLQKTAKSKLIDRQFHGTGDVFASTLSGFLTLGKAFEESIIIATKFTEMCINHTANDKDSQWYGLRFEECLHYLYEMK